MTPTLIDDAEILELALRSLTDEHARVSTKRDGLNVELQRIEEKMKRIRNYPSSSSTAPMPTPHAAKTPSGKRLRRGEPERLLREFLQRKNGTGASLEIIVKETGVARSTAHRVLGQLCDKGLIEPASERDFRWKTDSSSSDRTGTAGDVPNEEEI